MSDIPLDTAMLDIITGAKTKAIEQGSLTAHDRCDRCGAQAFVLFYNADTTPPSLLLFCKHHGDEHEPALLDKGFEATEDNRQALIDEVEAQKQLRS